MTMNTITARFNTRTSIPLSRLADLESYTIMTYAAQAASTPITVSSLIDGMGSSDSATITPIRTPSRISIIH